jgi:hypothetical protein
MGRPGNIFPFEVIRPPLTNKAMCVYKMTFSNGYYYIGGIINFGARIGKHLKRLFKKTHTSAVNVAFVGCKSVTFEFIEFINDRKKLNNREGFHLLMNVGKEKCLNKELKGHSASCSKRSKVRVVRLNLHNEIVNTYPSIVEAAKSIGYSANTFGVSLKKGNKIKAIIFRALDKNGNIIIPIKPEIKKPSNIKPVVQFDLAMNKLNRFESLTDAEKVLKISRRSIQAVASGEYEHTRGGFIFRYESSLNKTA